jgi:hypothetical protein
MACSLSLNVEVSTSQYCDDNYMDGDGYLVVMVHVNHILFGYLCKLRVGYKHPHVNQLNLAKLTCLLIVNLDASRLMSY